METIVPNPDHGSGYFISGHTQYPIPSTSQPTLVTINIFHLREEHVP